MEIHDPSELYLGESQTLFLLLLLLQIGLQP